VPDHTKHAPAREAAGERIEALTVGEFLEALASKSPVPGGGAVAGLAAAIAAALARMVVNFSTGKPALAAHAAVHDEAMAALRMLQRAAMDAANADAAAYARLNELMKLPATDARRQREWDDAVRGATAPPRAVVRTTLELLRVLERLCGVTNPNLRSDLAIAGIVAETATQAGAWNVRSNLPMLRHDAYSQVIDGEMAAALREAAERRTRIDHACAKDPANPRPELSARR
jgi:formiminotetrahydrofolate cyclodeaminase